MPNKSFYKTLILFFCAAFLIPAISSTAAPLTADQFLAQKKKAGAVSPVLSSLRSDPAEYADKIIELTGTVNGMVTSSDSVSFILTCNGETLLMTAGPELPVCVTDSAKIRALVKVNGQTSGLPQFQLQAAAYDYEIAAREKELAPKPKAVAKTPVKGKGNADLTKNAFINARQSNATRLSSRAMQIYNPYKAAIARFNPRLTEQQLDSITKGILAFSERYGIDPRLVVALILAESGFRPNATSRAGAMGLGQLMPGTARGMGVNNAYDTTQNIEASVKLIRGHLGKYGDLALALSAYNAGPGAVKKYNGIPPYRETQNYVRKVSEIYKALCGMK
ncbi:MAG: lytic transglycosylase domain-containing protein [Armatimonadota bacterium]